MTHNMTRCKDKLINWSKNQEQENKRGVEESIARMHLYKKTT